MSDVLKLSTPRGDAEADKISNILQLAEEQKKIKELEKNIADLKKLQTEKDKSAAIEKNKSAASPAPAVNKIAARKSDSFKAVSTAPSFNKTPVGSSTPPLPYPTTQDLSNSVATATKTNFNGDPAYMLDQSKQPAGKGDDAGTLKGVKSSTVNGEVKPTGGSTTFRVEKKWVVREGEANTMNGGNNPGIYITTQAASDAPAKTAEQTSNPPIEPTPKEQSGISKWWDKTKAEMGAAVEQPWEGVKGAAKGIANIPSQLAELMLKGSALQGAADMEQAAAMQSLFGQSASAAQLSESAAMVREGASQISVPQFSMNNQAQAGGDKIFTGVSLLAGGAGLVKSGVKGVAGLGKAGAGLEGGAIKGATKAESAVAAEGAKAGEGVAAETGKAAEAATPGPAGNGAKVLERLKSLRDKYLGDTPGKNSSKTGREVKDRMREEGKLRENVDTGRTEFQASDGKWYDLDKADMAHKTDAVTWWNETGRQYGAKAPEVRSWMLDSKNYYLELNSINRSQGSILGQTTRYLPPLK
jgi:Domain of unknown function (DUF4150)/HNH/ENDO VII superfamily nuclease with conserved GHE residues